jgi:hypothetical protein
MKEIEDLTNDAIYIVECPVIILVMSGYNTFYTRATESQYGSELFVCERVCA